MRAPRRTPYEHQDALRDLYRRLYPNEQCDSRWDEGYRESRQSGLAIVQVWLNRSACPHAVESTSSLIYAQQLDEQLITSPSASTSTHQSSSEWMIRSSYAMAIIRFVNSVVDAYQTALYAQSIFQISERIGLPTHLVEIRHAATHEDLPSLSVLRDACRESLHWLQVNFWRPTLSKSVLGSMHANGVEEHSLDEIQSKIELDEICRNNSEELMRSIGRYRRLSKKILKDESLRGRYRVSLVAAEKRIEACGQQVAFELRRVSGHTLSESEAKASMYLADALAEEGGLVPLSKRKRARIDDSASEAVTAAPARLQQLWLPLLHHLAAAFETFAGALQESIINRISSRQADRDQTYLDTLASWLIVLYGSDKPILAAASISASDLVYSSMNEEDEDIEMEKPTLRLARRLLAANSKLALRLVRQLCDRDDDLRERIAPLLEIANGVSDHSMIGSGLLPQRRSLNKTLQADTLVAPLSEASEIERSIAEMERNLQVLEEQSKPGITPPRIAAEPPDMTNSERSKEQAAICTELLGWHMAPSDWKPTPIGCLNGSVPDLLLY